MAESSAPHKLAEIEYLRALAIAYTIVAHLRFAYPSEPGWVGRLDSVAHFWTGVDLFFVISGFVIARSLVPQFLSLSAPDQRAARTRLLFTFWSRRVFRLWPSSWLWALLSIPIAAIWFDAHLHNTINDAVSGLLQVYNFHAWDCQNGAQSCSNLIIGVYWSLSLEEQFYVVLPLVLFAFGRRAAWVLGAMAAVGVSLSVFAPAVLAFFRWEGFVAGVLLAWALSVPHVAASMQSALFEPLGRWTRLFALVLVTSLPLIAHGALTSRPYPLAAVVSTLLVALAAFDAGYLGVPAILKRPLLYLGSRSFSLYLVHVPVMVVASRAAPRWFEGPAAHLPGWLAHLLWVGVSVAVMTLLADMNYRLVEERFRRRGPIAAT